MTGSTEDQAFEQVVQKIAPRSRLLRSWPLVGGISAEMTALAVEHPDGQRAKMIVRRPGAEHLRYNPRAAADEFNLLQELQSAGLAAPAPLYLDRSGQIFSTPYLVIQYIEGRLDFAPSNLADAILQLASHLAGIHCVDGSRLDLSFLPQRLGGCTELSTMRSTSIDRWWDEARIRKTLASRWPLPQRNAPVLLHGDYWPGNILWQASKLVAVIDWEDAGLGDPLVDLANSRLEIAWIFGIEAMQAFTHHYRSLMAIDDAGLAYWDLCAALRLARLAGSDLAGWAAFFAPFGRPDITEQTIRESYRWFIGQAYGKLGG
jgi:aminoglycoside phosphotransferase (APT) family kinase protein